MKKTKITFEVEPSTGVILAEILAESTRGITQTYDVCPERILKQIRIIAKQIKKQC